MNIYRNDKGVWRSYVQARRETNPELVQIIDRSPGAVQEYPDTRFWKDGSGRLRLLEDGQPPPRGAVILGGSYTLYTRIYLGLTPPVGHEPGYCAVVGELFDQTFEPRARPLLVLDEGSCFPDVDPSMALIPDLMEAACALKDLYLPAHEREGSDGLGGDRRMIVNPGHKQFLEELRKVQHGLCGYVDEEDMPDGEIKKRFPFFASRDRIAPLYEPPYKEDEDYGIKAVEAMANREDHEGRPMLRHHRCCSIFAGGQYRTPLRAVALCVLSLQTYQWTEALEGRFDYDGYEREDEEKAKRRSGRERRAEAKRNMMLEGILYMASDLRDRALLARSGREAYLKAAGIEDLAAMGVSED